MEINTRIKVQATVVIAEDHAVVRDGLKMLLGDVFQQPQFVEAADADSLTSALASRPRPYLALIDLNMPGMERGGRLSEIIGAHPEIPVVIVSALTSSDIVRRCLNLPSVFAFVSKGATAAQMAQAVSAAQQGKKSGLVQSQVALQTSCANLSPRLEEVRGLLRRGMSNKAIAQQLGISEGTVKNYMSDIFKVLNVNNRTQAAGIDGDH